MPAVPSCPQAPEIQIAVLIHSVINRVVLQNIEKQKLSAKGSQKNSASPVVSASDVKIISDLFTLVKRNDYRFNPNTASKVVDKDGKPSIKITEAPVSKASNRKPAIRCKRFT